MEGGGAFASQDRDESGGFGMGWSSIRLAALSLCLSVTSLLAQPTSATHEHEAAVAPSQPIASLPFELHANKIYLSVHVNGQGPFPFVYDSGSGFAVLDEDLARELQIETQGSFQVGGAGAGRMTGSLAQGVRFSCDGHDFGADPTLILPLDRHLRSTTGRRLAGLIGNYLPRRFTLAIDYARSRIDLFEVIGFVHDGSGVELPAEFEGGHVLVRATVTPLDGPAIEGRFILDTGARLAMSLNAPFVRQNSLLRGGELKTIVGHGIGGRVEHAVTRLDHLRLGDIVIEDPITTLSEDADGVLASSRAAGILGADILRKFTVIFDHRRARVILVPNASLPAPVEFDMSGLWFEAEGEAMDCLRIVHVVPGSAGAEAGLQEDDVIVGLEEAPSPLRRSDVVELLRSGDGRSLHLKVRRQDETHDVLLTLRRQI